MQQFAVHLCNNLLCIYVTIGQVHGCRDLSSLADLLKVSRMAQSAASGADDEFVAK
jgi:hypothetical protein